jgi:hypothetical protein
MVLSYASGRLGENHERCSKCKAEYHPNGQTFRRIDRGAGISGIDAAYHLQRRCPGKSFALLEN